MSRARRGSQASVRRRQRASFRLRGLHNAERLELRTLMAGDVVNPFHNAHFAADVNGDWKVTSLDAVLIINNLNATGTRELNTASARTMAQGEGTETSPEYLDVNGDGFLTPLDALLVINHLNAEGADPAIVSYRNVVRDPVTGQELAKTGAGTTADPYVYAIAPGQRFTVTTEVRDNRVGTLDAPEGADLYNTAPLGLFETFSDLFFDSSVAKLGFSEVQRISFTGLPTTNGPSMTLTLKVGGTTLVTTDLITNLRGGTSGNRNSTAVRIEDALNEALQAANAGRVTVTSAGNTDAFDIRFQGKLVDVDVAPLEVNALGGGATASVTTLFDLGSQIDLDLKANIVRALNYNALYMPELDPAGQRFLELYTPNALGTDTGILRIGGRAIGDTAVSPRDPLPLEPDEYTDYMRDNFASNNGYMIIAAPVFVAQGSGSTFINTDAPGEPDDPSNHGTTATLAIGNVTGSNPLVTQDRIAYPAMNSVKIVILADVTADDDLITNIDEDAPATNITTQILTGDTNNQNQDQLTITGFGPNGTDQTFTIAGQGTVSLNAGVVTFTPALNFAGNFVFQYGLTNDGTGTPKDLGLVTIAVNPVNDAPTAQPGAATTNEDVFVDIDLRTLVSDIETPVANLTFTFDNVVNGSVQILNGHTARFTPTGDFSGVGSFNYTVTDGGQGASAALSASNTVTITVNPVNDAPVVTPVTQTTAEDTSINIDLAAFVTDIETADGALTFSSVSVTNGTLTLVSGSTYTFTPALNFNGTAVLTFSVTDTGDGSSPATTVGPNTLNITVTPVDDPGTAPDQTVNVVEDVPTVLTLTGVTGGPIDESQAVTFGLTSATTAQGGLVEIVNNQIRYTSPANFYSQRYGNDTFSYTVTDSSGAIVTGQITVVVAPDTIDPPTANDDGLGVDVIEIPDAGVTVLPLSTLLANDSNEPDTPDNNNLAVSITDTTGLPTGVTVSVDNATQELTIDATDFQVPQSGDVTATFQYTITDVDGNTDTATVTITLIPNTLPRAVDDSYTYSETDIEADNTRDLNVIDGTLRPDRPYEDFDALRITGLSATEATSTDGSVVIGGITFAIDLSGRFITMTAPPGNLNLNGTFVLYYTLDEPNAAVVGDPPVQDIGKVTVTITPVNDAPTASPTSATLNEDVVYTIDLRTLVSDLETSVDDMTFNVGGAQNGTVALDADGYTARFTPTANYSGPASFTYTATDGGDGVSPALTTAPQTISLTYDPVNDAPVVTPVTLTTNEDTELLIDLANLVSDVETADGDLVFTNVAVTNGAIVHVSGSTYRYTPAANFSGAATLSFDVTDTGQAGGDEATVASGPLDITVNPVNDAPTASPDSDTTLEDNAITFDLRTLVSDVETAVANLTFAVSSPVGGTVALDADGFTARFTPTANFNGNASFTYTVTDGGQGASAALSASAQISITVTPDNDAPVVTPAAQTTAEDTALLIDLATMVSDVETADANLVFSDVVVTNGTIELVSGSTYRYTPTANYNGPAQLTFKVTDTGDGADAPIEVAAGPIAITVTPVNDAPVATGTTETLAEDAVYTIDLRTLVTDVETDGVTRPFTFSVSNAVNGTVVLDADGFTARFTPTADYFGAASFTYTATDDGDNGAAAKTTTAQTVSLTFTSVNDAPRPVADTFTTFKTNNSGATTLYDVLPNDIANQPFGETNETLTLTGATITSTTPAAASPNLPTVTVENGKLRFLPNGYAGTVVVTYTVSDGTLSETATATFTVRDFEPGVISGYVYADFDGDMVMDGQVGGARPERRLSDVEVWLVGKVAANVDPSQPTISVMTRTDATGRFVFNNDSPGLTQGLPPGTYVVQLDNPNTPTVEGAELTLDSPDSIKSVTVPNQSVLPVGTSAIVLGDNKIQVSFTELGIHAELNLAVQGLAPRFMSIRDHLNTTSAYGVVFAVNTADQSADGHQYWYSIYENVNPDGSLLSDPGWYGFQSLKLQVSANLSTAVLTAVDANGVTWTRTLSFTADYTKIRVMGSEGSNVVVRLEGSWTDFFPSAATVESSQQLTAAGEGNYAEGEGAAYAAAADEIYADEAWA